jgi:Protein of unknown function (DUF4199)
MQTTTQTALKWGAILGVIGIVQSTISNVFKLDPTETFYKYITYLLIAVLTIGGSIMAMRDYKSANGGFMSYGQGLGIGAMIGGVSGLLIGIYNFIYLKFIDGSILDRISEIQMQELEKKGMSSEEIEQAMKYASMFSGPGMMLVGSIIGGVFIYFLVSLIVSAVQKHEKPIFN